MPMLTKHCKSRSDDPCKADKRKAKCITAADRPTDKPMLPVRSLYKMHL